MANGLKARALRNFATLHTERLHINLLFSRSTWGLNWTDVYKHLSWGVKTCHRHFNAQCNGRVQKLCPFCFALCYLMCVQVRPSSLDLSKCYAILILVLSLLYNYMWASLSSFEDARPQVVTIYVHVCFSFCQTNVDQTWSNLLRWRWNCCTPTFMPPPSSFYSSSLRLLSLPKLR